MARVRNIKVTFRSSANNMGWYDQYFTDWYDFADWMKQQQELQILITIKGWNYEDKRI